MDMLCKMFPPDHEMDGGPDGEPDEPEPEEDVDLLVDDVHGQEAEAVLALDGAGGTVLVEGALGQLGEDAVHGVVPLLEGHLRLAEHLRAVLGELPAEEQVHQVDLRNHVRNLFFPSHLLIQIIWPSAHLEEDVDEVQDLAEDELVDVGVVRPEGPQDVVDDGLPAGVVLLDAVEDVLVVHVLNEHVQLSTWDERGDGHWIKRSSVMLADLCITIHA